MGLADAMGLAGVIIGVMFALLFVLATVEERFFMSTAHEADEQAEAPAFDLSNAA